SLTHHQSSRSESSGSDNGYRLDDDKLAPRYLTRVTLLY
ncbi:hypothetical protein CEXT_162861, partial [Caerostris extrusa]